ncbi:related to thymidylate kinase [Melanopsichium pennsylvanicum]|uniref:Thymidylate kinase n=2 Tax=Melanopsichium pennsylvanicum TaxID=63383 RepID=A0AAJ4XNF9_9BASI|nr:related to thymidylate kinase [Melanopsichium pennsylvanicum]
MSNFTSPSRQVGVDADTDRSPRRKLSTDLMRIKNFPSTLSLRKQDQDHNSIPSANAFSRFKPFGQSRRSVAADHVHSSTDTKSSKRASRLLDAFMPSKKPPPSFQVVRKPPNRSTTSFHSSSHQPSPQADIDRPNSSLSVHKPPELPELAPRISLSAPHHEIPPQLPSVTSALATTLPSQDMLNPGSRYPPSTTNTRRLSNNPLGGSTARTTSDPYLNLGSASNSRAQSPSAGPHTDEPNPNSSFSLHSFRNVRSTSDVSAADDPSTHTHSRVHSIISVDEYATPGEELPEPRFMDDNGSASINLDKPKFPEASRAQSVSPVANAKPASISAAKFRQAASRQRSESGNIPTIETLQGGSGFARPPRSRTPSHDLAAMEAILAQTHPRAYLAADADRRKSPDPVALTSTVSAVNLADDTQRKKRGFFIVVEGLDRAGKSTQVERLAEHFQAKAIKFPERTTAIGQMINSYLAQTSDLDDQAVHLLFSANRWECVASIKNTLDAGESIVCDRYAFSGIAYSVAKGLSYDWCRNPDVGLPLPDLTMFLDLDAQTAAARGGYGEERYEKLDFQAKVRDAFGKVSADVRAHGGRWVTIDASQSLDQVTDDIQKAVQRVTSSIHRVGAKQLGKLFVSDSRPENVRQGSSSELYPSAMIPNMKRSSMSSEDSGRKGKSLDQPRVHINTAATSATFPASRPMASPLTYSEQLAAVRSAAAGTLSGLFGGSNATLDQQSPAVTDEKQQPEADGPSPVNAIRGQGYDSARLLARYPEGSGRRRTLIDVIGEIENQQPIEAAWTNHQRSLSAAAVPTSPTLQSPIDGSPSTSVPTGKGRRSTDHGRVSQLPTIASTNPRPVAASRSASLTVQPGASSVSNPSTPLNDDKPLHPSASMRASSFSSAGNNVDMRPSTLSPAARAVSPAITTSSRSSIASPTPVQPTSWASSPIARPGSTPSGPATELAYMGANNHCSNASDPNLLSSQHLSMLNAQQGQSEMQEQYMRNYMAMMANPMLAQQAHYQMMLQRHQQQYYGRAASAIGVGFGDGGGGSKLGAGANGVSAQQNGGPPLAAFMQQPAQVQVGTQHAEGGNTDALRSTKAQQRRTTHKRTQSSGSQLDNNAGSTNGQGASASTSQPMLSMMMAPPPPSANPLGTNHNHNSNNTMTPTITSPNFGSQHLYGHAQPHSQQPMYSAATAASANNAIFYSNGPQFPPQQEQRQQQQQQQMMMMMMGGSGGVGAWGMAGAGQMEGGGGAYGMVRPLYAGSRSEIGVPGSGGGGGGGGGAAAAAGVGGGLRYQRSTENGLKLSQQHQQHQQHQLQQQ